MGRIWNPNLRNDVTGQNVTKQGMGGGSSGEGGLNGSGATGTSGVAGQGDGLGNNGSSTPLAWGNGGAQGWADWWGNVGNQITGQNPVIDANADGIPGNVVDTQAADEDRRRQQAFMDALQHQAQTGDGAWQQALAASTGQAQNSASALAQLQGNQGQDIGATLRNMHAAQAGAQQQAVGQGDIMRAQTQQQAAQQYSNLMGQQQGTDIAQSAADAAARQAALAATQQQRQQNQQNMANFVSGVGQAIPVVGGAVSGAVNNAIKSSHGGPVPGKAKTFGDDESNDTVPAWLSPGEIVIPRSIAQHPDAARRAAAFVDAVQRQGADPKQDHFPGGGVVPGSQNPNDTSNNREGDFTVLGQKNPNWGTGSTTTGPLNLGGQGQAPGGGTNATEPVGANFNLTDQWGNPNGQYGGAVNSVNNPFAQQASEGNGGILRRGQYEPNRAAVLGNIGNIYQPGADAITGGQLQQATANNLNAAITGGKTQGQLGAAQVHSGETVANEQNQRSQANEMAAAQQLQNQRARDLSFAQAQQQAAWNNTMQNINLSNAQQQFLKGIYGGAGQAAIGLSSMLSKSSPTSTATSTNYADVPTVANGYSDTSGSAPSIPDTSGDTSYYQDTMPAPSPIDPYAGGAHGGVIQDDKRARAFLAALEAR